MWYGITAQVDGKTVFFVQAVHDRSYWSKHRTSAYHFTSQQEAINMADKFGGEVYELTRSKGSL